MRPWVWLAASLTAFSLAFPAFAFDNASAKAVMTNAVEKFIRPSYRDLHLKSAALTAETEKLCAAPSEDGLKAVQARFSDLVTSWGHIEFMRLGPVMDEHRLERVLFYPDRKATGMKQVQALLAEPDDSMTDVNRLAGHSVAMQGLSAFEYVFFGSYPEGIASEKDNFRCRYGLAIATNIQQIAGELQTAWDKPDGIASDWINPSATNPVYRDSKEQISALIGIAVHGLEMVRDQRMKSFYKGRDFKKLPKGGVFWRSGLTMTALKANTDGIANFWNATDFPKLLGPDQYSLSDSVLFDLKTASSAIGKAGQPTAEKLADDKYLGRLDFIEFQLKDAITRIDVDIGGAVGLGAGFSFGDGD